MHDKQILTYIPLRLLNLRIHRKNECNCQENFRPKIWPFKITNVSWNRNYQLFICISDLKKICQICFHYTVVYFKDTKNVEQKNTDCKKVSFFEKNFIPKVVNLFTVKRHYGQMKGNPEKIQHFAFSIANLMPNC